MSDWYGGWYPTAPPNVTYTTNVVPADRIAEALERIAAALENRPRPLVDRDPGDETTQP